MKSSLRSTDAWLVLLSLGAYTLGACASVPEPDSTATSSVKQSLPNAGSGVGYLHTAAKSRFRIGTNTTTILEFGVSKLVGTEGVFGIVPETGWAMAIPNATAPSRAVAPLSLSPDVHNRAVIDYFIGAGLPANQIGWVNAHGSVHAAGISTEDSPPDSVADSYITAISRVIDGIDVGDSFAWAHMNADGDSVEEGVYWPEIPTSVVEEAASLKSKLADPTNGAVFRSKLPPNVGDGRVVIHHSKCIQKTAFEAVTSYDVPGTGGGMATTRHFDTTGTQFLTSDEVPPVLPITQKSQ